MKHRYVEYVKYLLIVRIGHHPVSEFSTIFVTLVNVIEKQDGNLQTRLGYKQAGGNGIVNTKKQSKPNQPCDVAQTAYL